MVFSWLIFLLSGGVADARPKLAFGVVRYADVCSQNFAAMEPPKPGPGYDMGKRIRMRNASFRAITDEDNRQYIALAKEANSGRNNGAKLFLDVENAVLKNLNDEAIQDRELVTAITNLYKDVVWQEISSDKILSQAMRAKYSDFKSLRFAFAEDNVDLRGRASRLFSSIGEKFGVYLDRLIAKEGWEERMKGLSADPRHWHHAGIGASPDEAGAASRASRSMIESGQQAVLRSFAGSAGALTQASRQAAKIRAWVAKRFAQEPHLMTAEGVLSAEAIEAMLKAGGSNADVARALRQRFRLQVSDKEAAVLQKYLQLANQFSPGLLLEKRVVIDMAQPARGVISADFKGQNARNLEETLKALARSESLPLAGMIREVRAGEAVATAALERKKAIFQRALDEVFPGLRAEFTGDDGLAFVPFALDAEMRKKFQAAYLRQGQAEDLRLAFVPFDSVPVGARSSWIVKAEALEKKLRLRLIEDLPREKLNALQIGIFMPPERPGFAVIHLSGEDAEVGRVIKARAEELGYSAKIEFNGKR